MLTRSIRFLVENKPFTLVIGVFILFFGIIYSPFNFGLDFFPKNPIAVDAIPNIGENQQIVFTEWQGKSPKDIEDQITYPLTSNLMGIPGVKSVRSNSMFGFSNIYLIFKDDVDFYWARNRILERLNSLPRNLLPDDVNPRLGPDATALGQVFWYTLEGRDEQGNVTGGWNLEEVRSIQDFYIKNALASTYGVSEVSSIGGYVKEYQVDLDPELMKQYGVSLDQLIGAIQRSNQDIGAKTLEINQVEYFVRGLGFVESVKDIEETSITSSDFSSIRIKDVASVSVGPAERRGILDKGGAEVVGGVVTAQFGENPMQVISALKDKINEIQPGLPSKTLQDGTASKLTIVPFYDRSELITETLDTLGNALFLEILVAILVVLVMISSVRASLLITGGLPLSILLVFIAMKLFHVEANIVALSGIAIAIGTMVDLGIILVENMVQQLERRGDRSVQSAILDSTKEVSGAILTAGLTTIVSFIPVFSLTGAEGKLFIPLAFTKTAALAASMAITLLVLPTVSVLVFSRRKTVELFKTVFSFLWILLGLLAVFYGIYLGYFLILIGLINVLEQFGKLENARAKKFKYALTIITLLVILGVYWMPLGYGFSSLTNLIVVLVLVSLVLVPFHLFIKYYQSLLGWVLDNKIVAISISGSLVILGFLIMLNTGKEFMPSLDEGDFLLMPTSMPHAGVAENKSTLAKLDMAVSAIPEVDYVVGKAGRAETTLDPAPLFMYENIISYKSEFITDIENKPIRFKTNGEGLFETYSGQFVEMGSGVDIKDLIRDEDGKFYRNWRSHIQNENDIWNEIVSSTQLPGVTSAPKLYPIETRLVMLQTGMRSPFGILIKGQDLETVERFGLQLESILKEVEGIRSSTVFSDRITGKPYLILKIDREKISRYGLSVEEVQRTLEVAIGGKTLTKTVEGREGYDIRLRYPRELRATPEDLEAIYISSQDGTTIPLQELVKIEYEKGPQMIKSEDGFLVGHVTFDKDLKMPEVEVIENAKREIDKEIVDGGLIVPQGISWEFKGSYENHLHAQKTLQFTIPLVLLVILMILYFQFRSISISLMVFSGVAVAFAGGFILIWLYGQPWFLNIEMGTSSLRDLLNVRDVNLSVAVWVGFIALFGIATDDGVIMATYLKQSFDKNRPNDLSGIRKSVILAGNKRVRACLMTTATTLLALFPVLTSTGRGSDIMVPMAIPCFGGMLMALVTLFVVPLLFCWEKELILKRDFRNGSNV